MNEQKTLATKMAAIMGEVATMIKGGTNVQQKYAYVTAEDVKAAIRPLLKKHKVAVFSQMIDVQRETYTNKNQTLVVTVLAKMCFTVVCGDTGERIDCLWYGEANDYADKAVNKAATAAEKYWLINTFLLSTSEPDSDYETIVAPKSQQGLSVVGNVPETPYAPNEPLPDPRYEKWESIESLGKQLFGDEWVAQRNQMVKAIARSARSWKDLGLEQMNKIWQELEEINKQATTPDM